ncbi:hypothetical protein C8R44DRAFT_551917, partial [Mycena epipterygia]
GLFGVLVVQVCLYFTAFPNDQILSKLPVVFALVVEIAAIIANTRDSIIIFGSDWGNPAVHDEFGWSAVSIPISACIGQTFFAWGIYIIDQTLYIPALI